MKATKYITIICFALMSTTFAHAQADMDPAPMEGQQIVKHHAFTLSYCEFHEQPTWVSYLLTREDALAQRPRHDAFRADPDVETGSAAPKDYVKSGYDKGHLAPNADMSRSEEVQNESFYMSNMSPQRHGFNAGIWKRLEAQVRHWAIEYDSIYVVTGPVLICDSVEADSLNISTIGQSNTISVPRYFYKVIYSPCLQQAIAFLVPHENKKGSVKTWVVPVDRVEEATGIDFFPALDDTEENIIESEVCTPCWIWDR